MIQADWQTNGYGRFKRPWISLNSSNIYLSIVLKPNTYSSSLSNLTQYISLIICRLLEKYSIQPVLKWPNDVLVSGAKIAGLLGETSFRGSQLRGYVLGAGINLNLSHQDLNSINQKATSLNQLINKQVERDTFLNLLLEAFFADYESVLQNGFKKIQDEYESRCPFIEKKIKVNLSNESFDGIAKGFTEDGCLILMLDSGEEKVITVGDVYC